MLNDNEINAINTYIDTISNISELKSPIGVYLSSYYSESENKQCCDVVAVCGCSAGLESSATMKAMKKSTEESSNISWRFAETDWADYDSYARMGSYNQFLRRDLLSSHILYDPRNLLTELQQALSRLYIDPYENITPISNIHRLSERNNNVKKLIRK